MSETEIEAPPDEYVGPAEVSRQGRGAEVHADLRGHFDPLDGRFHWYGRIAANDAVSGLSAGCVVTLITPHGSAEGRLSDVDPWGRYRISGTGRPPF